MRPILTHPLYLITFLTLALSPLTLFAHDFEAKNCDGITIYYNKFPDNECGVTYFDNNIDGETYSGDITIPATVTSGDTIYAVICIGHYAFRNCTSLTSISLPSTVTSISSSAFWGCTSLTTISLPEGLFSIDDSAFGECSSLTSITIPRKGVTYIHKRAFLRCTSLTSIIVDPANPCYSTHDGALFDKDQSTLICCPCGKQGSLNLPNTVTTIGDQAFDDYALLTSINVDPANPNYSSHDGVLLNKDQSTLICCPRGKQGSYIVPSTVTTIDSCAFQHCTSLTSISLPEGLTTISMAAFSFCSSLTSISLPKSLTTIGDFAFWKCTAITSITNLATTPQEINDKDVFEKVPLSTVTLHVPHGSLEAYHSAPVWQQFSIILELPN